MQNYVNCILCNKGEFMKYLRVENCLIAISNIKDISYNTGGSNVCIILKNNEVIETKTQNNTICVKFELVQKEKDKTPYDSKRNCFCYTNLVFGLDSIVLLGGDQITIDDSFPTSIEIEDIAIILKLKK